MTVLELTTTSEAPAKSAGRKNLHRAAWTSDRRKALAAAVANYQASMRLVDWTITIDWDKPCAKDALATITPMADSRHATLRLSPEYIELPPSMRTQVILHELAHCLLFPIDDLALSTVKHLSRKGGAAIYEIAHASAIERAVDAVADALLPHVPPVKLP